MSKRQEKNFYHLLSLEKMINDNALRIVQIKPEKNLEVYDGLVILADIFWASTNIAYLLANNVLRILPVSTIERAFDLRIKDPSIFLAGEYKGERIPGFDLGRWPSELSGDLSGKQVAYRSSQGIPKLLRIKSAHGIILGSYPVAGAIIKFIQKNKINKIYTCGLYGVEDQLFCEYLTARLIGEKYSLDPMMSYLKSDPEAQKFFDPNDLDHKIIDIYQAIAEDVFNFVPMESITNKIRTIVKHEI